MNPQQTSPNDNENPRDAQFKPAPQSGQNAPLEPTPPRPAAPNPPRPQYTPSGQPSGPKPPNYAMRGLWSIIQLIIGAAVLAFIINHLVFQPYEVFGQSMVPTLHEGDRLIVSKLGKTWSTITRDDYMPKRGEIIVFHNPSSQNIQLVKRVVGLPGNRVVVNGGNIIVYTSEEPQGFNFDQRFGLELAETVGNLDITVPPDEIFVVGDNRLPNGSLDSRNELGTVPLEQVVGDLVFRIFPVSDADVF